MRKTVRATRLQFMLANMPEDCWIIVGYRAEHAVLNASDSELEKIPQDRLMVIHGMLFREQYQ